MAQSSRAKMKMPNALFEFVVKEGEVSEGGREVVATQSWHISQSKEKIKVDFTHKELFEFYGKVLFITPSCLKYVYAYIE